MIVYANLLGKWTELTDEYTIDGTTPEKFVENILIGPDAYKTSRITNSFVEIMINNTAYHVHESCIQYIYKK